MARSPELEARLLEEITAFRAAHGDEPITIRDYDERPLSFALLAECLRRYPPFPVLPRTALKSGVVPPDPETGIGGFRYLEGAMFLCCIAATGLDPDRWPDPHTFRIDRFLEGVPADASRIERGRAVRRIRRREEALDFIPFSEGPGRCPGQNFNTHEFLLVLDAMLPRFRFERADPSRNLDQVDGPIAGPEPGAMAIRLRRR